MEAKVKKRIKYSSLILEAIDKENKYLTIWKERAKLLTRIAMKSGEEGIFFE